MNIFDNFINKKECKNINEMFLSKNFPWYYSKDQTNSKDTSFMFHIFYRENQVNTHHYDLIEPILNKLNPKKILHIRANLCFKRPSKCDWHVDKLTQDLKHKTAIYYVNTNNGYTLFKNKKVNCEKNKIVIFDADQKHKAKIQTNTDTRMVININYEYI